MQPWDVWSDKLTEKAIVGRPSNGMNPNIREFVIGIESQKHTRIAVELATYVTLYGYYHVKIKKLFH